MYMVRGKGLSMFCECFSDRTRTTFNLWLILTHLEVEQILSTESHALWFKRLCSLWEKQQKQLFMTLWLLPSLFLMFSFLQALCSIFFHDAVFYSVVDARLTLQKSPELSLLAILTALVLRPAHSSCPGLPEIPTLSTSLRKLQLYLGFTFLLCAMNILYGQYFGGYYWA